MSKYDPLHDFLVNIPSGVFEKNLTFDEIEKILGFRLPQSALNHRAWWENPTSSDYHPYAQSWLTAGWKVANVNQSEKWVQFQRG
jgi:hypothetical protein